MHVSPGTSQFVPFPLQGSNVIPILEIDVAGLEEECHFEFVSKGSPISSNRPDKARGLTKELLPRPGLRSWKMMYKGVQFLHSLREPLDLMSLLPGIPSDNLWS
jgi:hypothetical protein